MGVDKPNYTQIPNLLLEDLMMHMSEAELKVTLAISRQTFGYHRDRIKLSLTTLQELTGLSRPTVVKGINEGMERGTITRQAHADGSYVYALSINGDTQSTSKNSLLGNKIDQEGSKESLLPSVKILYQSSKESLLPLVNNIDQNTPTLKKVLKKVLKKEERESAPTRVVSPREPAAKAVRHKSPHLDPRHFVNGYVPPGTGTSPVEVYYERFSINQDAARLNAIKEDDLARLCTDLDKLREVVTAYSRTPFQLGNVQLILDWYKDGIPEKHRAPPATNGVYKNGALSEAEKSVIVTRAKMARASLQTAQKFGMRVDPQWQQDIEAAKAYGL